MKFWFLLRNYPEESVDKEMDKAKFNFYSVREKAGNEQVKDVHLLVAYNLSLNIDLIRSNRQAILAAYE